MQTSTNYIDVNRMRDKTLEHMVGRELSHPDHKNTRIQVSQDSAGYWLELLNSDLETWRYDSCGGFMFSSTGDLDADTWVEGSDEEGGQSLLEKIEIKPISISSS